MLRETETSSINTTTLLAVTPLLSGDQYDIIRFRILLWKVGHGYIMFFLILLGILGNILSLVILTRKSVRTSMIAVYLRALAIADISVLVTAFFRYKTYKLFLTETQEIHFLYNIHPYIEVYVEPFHWISLGMSSFVTLSLSTERYLAVKYPLTIRKVCTPNLVRVCLIATLIIVIIITVPNFFSYRVSRFSIDEDEVYVAVRTKLGKQTLYPCTYHIYVIPLLWYLSPWILLATLNTLLAVHVHKSSKIRVGVLGITNPNRNLSVLIITIVVVYMVCNFPICIMVFYKLVNHMTENSACIQQTTGITSPTSRAFDVIQIITEILNILNSCVNICVYCMVGTKFRRELKKILHCNFCKKLNQVNPGGNEVVNGQDSAVETTVEVPTRQQSCSTLDKPVTLQGLFIGGRQCTTPTSATADTSLSNST